MLPPGIYIKILKRKEKKGKMACFEKLKRKRGNMGVTISTNIKQLSEQTRMNGVNIRGIYLSGGKKTTSKGNPMFTFSILVGDVENVRVPAASGTKEKGVLTLKTRARDDSLVDKTDDVDIRSWSKLMYITTFKFPSDVKHGDYVNLYDFFPEISLGKDDRVWKNNKCYAVKRLPYTDKELLEEYKQIPRELYHIERPSYDDQYRSETVFLDVHLPTDVEFQKETGSYTFFSQEDGNLVIPTEKNDYVFNKDEGDEICFKASFEHNQWKDGEVTSAFVRLVLWPNHLATLGIVNPETWMALGPKMVKNLDATLICYTDTKRTLNMTMNDPDTPSSQGVFDFGVEMKVNNLVMDPLKYIRNVGYKMSKDFVMNHFFKKKTMVQSPWAQKNKYSNDLTPPFINLCEYHGNLKEFGNKVEYFFVCDADIDPDEHEQLDEMSLEKRAACFMKKKDAKLKMKWSVGQVFAVFPEKKKKARVD